MAYHEAYITRRWTLPPSIGPRELSPLVDTNHHAAYGSSPNLVTRPTDDKRKATSCLSRAFTNLRGAILQRVAPAHGGTAFAQDERQKRAIEDLMQSNPDPWHEYGRLDSDVEDDCRYKDDDSLLYLYKKKMTRMSKFKAWLSRISTKYEDAMAPQGAAYIYGA
jgi:hypothetical protein